LSKVIASQFSHQMFNVSALLLDDALKTATPLTIGAIQIRLRSSDVKCPIITKFFVNKPINKTFKNSDQMPVTSVMMSLGTGKRKYRPTSKQNVFESRSWP